MASNYFKVLGRVRTQEGPLGQATRVRYVFFDDDSITSIIVAKEKAGEISKSIRTSGLVPVLSVFRPCTGLITDHGLTVVTRVGECPDGTEEGSG
jgi:hypothetical protein